MKHSSDQGSSNDSFEQRDSFTISDRDTLKLIIHPLRSRLITSLARGRRTVRELSEALELPQTKLYYHIKLLLQAGIIAAVGERRVGNLTETSYQAVAKSFIVDPGFAALEGDDFMQSFTSWTSLVQSELNEAYRNLVKAKEDGTPWEKSVESVALGLHSVRLTKEEAADFWKKFEALLAGLKSAKEGTNVTEGDDAGSDTKLVEWDLAFAWFPKE